MPARPERRQRRRAHHRLDRDAGSDLCAAIPDLQGLSFYAQTDPIGITAAILEDRQRVELAIADDMAHDREDLARSRRRFRQAQTQSVSTAARGE